MLSPEMADRRLLGQAEALAPASPRLRYEDRSIVNANGSYRFVELRAIRCIRAEGN